MHLFPDTGYYNVHQKIENKYGCADTSSRRVYIRPVFSFYVPNALRLNGVNNHFNGYGIGIKEYELLIFNRWGEKLFTSHNLSQGWDASMNGKPVEEGVYAYVIHLKDVFNQLHEYTGILTVIH